MNHGVHHALPVRDVFVNHVYLRVPYVLDGGGCRLHRRRAISASLYAILEGAAAQGRQAGLARWGGGRHLPASACLEWALQKGASTSTAPEDSTKGLGLSLLTDFIRLNQGWMDIYSHEGHLRVDGVGVKTTELDVGFEGTLITIGLRCDERFYIFADEVGDDQVF